MNGFSKGNSTNNLLQLDSTQNSLTKRRENVFCKWHCLCQANCYGSFSQYHIHS